jgi:hypothetical protein
MAKSLFYKKNGCFFACLFCLAFFSSFCVHWSIFHADKGLKKLSSFLQVSVRDSLAEAMHVPSVTKFNDDYIPTYEDMTVPERVATIQYNVTLSSFIGNARGILAEHNHVDFANNVWKWNINHTVVENTRSGGLEIEVISFFCFLGSCWFFCLFVVGFFFNINEFLSPMSTYTSPS